MHRLAHGVHLIESENISIKVHDDVRAERMIHGWLRCPYSPRRCRSARPWEKPGLASPASCSVKPERESNSSRITLPIKAFEEAIGNALVVRLCGPKSVRSFFHKSDTSRRCSVEIERIVLACFGPISCGDNLSRLPHCVIDKEFTIVRLTADGLAQSLGLCEAFRKFVDASDGSQSRGKEHIGWITHILDVVVRLRPLDKDPSIPISQAVHRHSGTA